MTHNTNTPLALARIVYLHVGFDSSRCASAVPDIELNLNFKLDICSNWKELFSKISSPISPPAAILIHLNTLRTSPSSIAEITSMINTMPVSYTHLTLPTNREV